MFDLLSDSNTQQEVPLKSSGITSRFRAYIANHKKLLEYSGTLFFLALPVLAFAFEGHSIASSPITTKSGASSNPGASSSQVEGASVNNGSSEDSQAANSSSSTNTNSTSVTVNGQNIPVPQNGSVQQTIPNSDGTGSTSVNVTQSHTGSGDTSTQNSSSLHVSTHSSGNNDSSSSVSSQSTQDGG